MLLVLFYMQLQQPTPQRFPPGVIYMVFTSNNEAPELDRTLYVAPFCPHLLARRKKNGDRGVYTAALTFFRLRLQQGAPRGIFEVTDNLAVD